MITQDEAKKLAGLKVIEQFIEKGMILGLGSGTTSHFFVRELGLHVGNGLDVTCTTTSKSTSEVAREVGINIYDPNDLGKIDLTIDGPDEINNEFNMIKGGGACLLWEKIIAHSSKKNITICDETKIVSSLGTFPLPVEIVQFGWKQTNRLVKNVISSNCSVHVETQLRTLDTSPVVTDSGNFILDCKCEKIMDPGKLEKELNMIPGVVENGLFTRESSVMVIGKFDGTVDVLFRET